MSAQQHIQLAKALPGRLQRILARWPHPSIVPPNHVPTGFQLQAPNPFAATKHPVTGLYHDPKYSLRRQAEIVKLAREHGVEELLPPTVKGTENRIAKRVEFGLRVKGTGVGQKVKGKIHERMVMPRMEKRREAILAMPKLIKEWKKVGKKNWTKFPK
ncbi:60s ribosomal protein l25 [Colletotrichum karsti]|uniref:60s ribosomal protein l25 n=1 Tax=Colletotrichum karsti TaxID=1095194 RepID=A0A9P6LP57_9PEZI|nr:60s ribosomal protein l25 [Colletotrichum karsti]KAF9879272.1 60s ribosomal protein l25 [Colletotrichum karsti]